VDNLDHGVVAVERATLIVEGCTIARNAVSGVLLGGAAAASRVKDNLIEENGGTGVFIEGGRGRIVGNRIRRNDVGIGVVEGAMPTIEDNEIEANRLGLGVRGSGTHPRVSRNTITDCTDEGVIVDDEAAGRFEANVVRGCGGPGVRVTDRGSAPDLVGNHVAGSAVGVLVTAGAGGEFRSNDLRGNTRGSWLLDEAGPLARADNLEDTGTTPTDLLGPRPGAPDRSAPPGLLN
jgi:nitrous oxidase accessory protein NosD